MKKYYVLDTSSLLRLMREPDKLRRIFENSFIIIPHLVQEEIKDMESRMLLNIISHNISVIDPSNKFMRVVIDTARKIGVLSELSDTDLTVVAIAKELISKGNLVTVITEDLAIQNLCEILNIPYNSIKDRKIRVTLKTYKKCQACGRIYNASLEECPFCGNTKYVLIKKKYET